MVKSRMCFWQGGSVRSGTVSAQRKAALGLEKQGLLFNRNRQTGYKQFHLQTLRLLHPETQFCVWGDFLHLNILHSSTGGPSGDKLSGGNGVREKGQKSALSAVVWAEPCPATLGQQQGAGGSMDLF